MFVKSNRIANSSSNRVEIIPKLWCICECKNLFQPISVHMHAPRNMKSKNEIQTIDKYFNDDWRYLNVNKHNGWIEWQHGWNVECSMAFVLVRKFCASEHFNQPTIEPSRSLWLSFEIIPRLNVHDNDKSC